MIPSSPEIDKILQSLTESVDEIEAAVVVGVDGLPIAANLPEEFDETLLSAMSAALLTVGERAASDLGKGALHQVFAQGDSGAIIMVAAGPDSVLMVSTTTSSLAGLGLVFINMERAAKKIAKKLNR
ncbi:MAG: roadblock/LC7 domain-containing protein [Candidatus Odinarchaeota archaeon]